jgi:hypothetical protein
VPAKAAADDAYILLGDNTQGVYTVKTDSLHVKYYSFNAPYAAKLSCIDDNGGVIKQWSQKIISGDNYFDLSVMNGFQQEKNYRFSITDIDNKIHSLTFRIKK